MQGDSVLRLLASNRNTGGPLEKPIGEASNLVPTLAVKLLPALAAVPAAVLRVVGDS
jgi:hypothetical protein